MMGENTMTPEQLCSVGEALFGPHWRSPLADALKINIRTVQRWAAGTFPIPSSALPEMREALELRRLAIGKLLDDTKPF